MCLYYIEGYKKLYRNKINYETKANIMQSNITTLFQKGIYLANQKAYDAAAKCFELILKHDPDRVDAIVNSGLMHYYAGHYELAERYILSSISKNPYSADSYYHLGLIYKASNNIHCAIASYQLALNCNPNFDLAWYNFGEILFSLEQYKLAINCFEKVIAITPDFEDAYLNLGESHARQEHFHEAIQFFKQLLTINSNHTEALYNLGVAYNGLRQYDNAIATYDKVISIDPDHVKSHYNKSFILLADGNFVNGFSEYEWRLKKKSTYKSQSQKPMWQGNQIQSKTMLVYAEQGFGDCIQFIRFLPLIKNKVKKIIVECQSELVRLFSNLDTVDQIIPRGAPLPDHDFQASLLSMGYFLNITLDNLPAQTPYLMNDYPLPKEIANHLYDNQKIKIGLVWGGTGSSLKKTDMGRSLPLQAFQSLLDMKDCQWFSFQKGARSIELNNSPGEKLIDLGQYCHDFADTASAACKMDLIITVDTAMAHLAGALGLNVWTLLSFDSDWRWLKNLNYSPWYPGMRLFRQDNPENWKSVLAQVKNELANYLSQHKYGA
jgi:tetratricopeptide (TPR) repeat protein